MIQRSVSSRSDQLTLFGSRVRQERINRLYRCIKCGRLFSPSGSLSGLIRCPSCRGCL